MNEQETKKHIFTWIKKNPKINCELGEITIGSKLGEGGNALVFKAEFAGNVAIKFLAESINTKPSNRYKRFIDEYRNLVKLVPTKAIVPLYHFAIQDMDGQRIPYILMEECASTLKERYKNAHLEDLDEFESLLERLMEVLEVIHNANIVHRDLKPENILLRQNGDWVLGDFGIAWFDEKFYTKLAKTSKDERLANFAFSAPEQSLQGINSVSPSMDLYALGQILYFCVMGNVIKGTEFPRFSQFIPDLHRYDAVIEMLIRQVPSERFQSIGEVRQFIKEQNRTVGGYTEAIEKVEDLNRTQQIFNDALRSSIPGVMGHYRAKNREEINRIMLALAKCCEECNLWWFEGLKNCPACPIEYLDDDIWLIDTQECQIKDLIIYRHTIYEYQYVLIHLSARPPFGIYDEEIDIDTEEIYEDIGMKIPRVEEAYYYKGRYITTELATDGYEVIDGKPIKLEDPQQRWRTLDDDFLVLVPQLSVYNSEEYDDITYEVYKNLHKDGKITPTALAPLLRLKRLRWMRAFD